MENNGGIKSNNSSPEELQRTTRERNKVKQLFINYGLLIVTIIVFFIFSFIVPRFTNFRNILNLLGQGSIIGILSIGLTNIIICGEFDISFAEIAGLCSLLSVLFVGVYHFPVLLTYVIVIIIGLSISIVNGINVVYFGIPSFIATLGMMTVLVGVSKWITGGAVLYCQLPKSFELIGRIRITGVIPSILISFFIIAFFVAVFLELTFKGRHFYAVGSNAEAAKRVGINVAKIKFEAFIVQGIIASIGGLLMASLFGIGSPDIGHDFVFPAIIVAFLGAVFLREGIPNIFGTIIASLLFAEIANGLIMIGADLWIKELFQGVILLFAVTMVSILKPGGIPGVHL